MKRRRSSRRPPHSPARWLAAMVGGSAVVLLATTGFSREPAARGAAGADRSPREMSGKLDPVPVPAPPELAPPRAPAAVPAAAPPTLAHAVFMPAVLEAGAAAGTAPVAAGALGGTAPAAAGALAGTAPAAAGALAGTAPAAAAAAAAATAGARKAIASRRFVYMASAKKLSDVLRDFAASQAVPAVLADGIEGIVNGNFDTTASEFLDAVSQAYGVLWYHDGTAYYFYPARAIQSRMYRLKGYSREQLVDLLTSFGLGDARYPIRYNAAQQTVMVYGPPRHVELVTHALETLDLGAAEGNEPVVRVFRLRYAAAGDRMMGDMRMAGVVTTLRGLYARGPAGGGEEAAPGAPPTLLNKIKAVQPTGDARKLAETVMGPGGKGGTATAERADETGDGARGLRSPVNLEDDRPMFEADEASNSVVVQGRAHRMREYEALIRRLDQKPLLLELEATIIDVTADNVRLLGIDWAAQNNRASVSVVQPPGGAPQTPAGALVDGAAFSIGTVVAGAGRELLARVNALQGEGKARIQSKPSILGVANRPAIMKEKRIATVRVAGNLDVKVFQVEAGTLLQVTPQVTLAPDGSPQIKLQLYIEDGNFESNQVDQVPVVKKTEIRTEAHVKEGESLLIGGLVVDGDVQLQNAVPVLGRLPLVGALFRNTSSRATRVERLFMITPRVVNDGAATSPAGAVPAEVPGTQGAGVSAAAMSAREAQMDALVNNLRVR